MRRVICAVTFAAAIAAGTCIVGAPTGAGAPTPITVGIDDGGPWVVRFHAHECIVLQNPFESMCGFGGFLAYYNFTISGISVATGDVDGDGRVDVLTAPGLQDRGEVRAYTGTGAALPVAVPVNLWGGGSRAVAGDVNGDGRDEIVAAEDRGAPNVQVFDARTGARLLQFGVIQGRTGVESVRVAAGDVTGDGRDEIVAGYGPGARLAYRSTRRRPHSSSRRLCEPSWRSRRT